MYYGRDDIQVHQTIRVVLDRERCQYASSNPCLMDELDDDDDEDEDYDNYCYNYY